MAKFSYILLFVPFLAFSTGATNPMVYATFLKSTPVFDSTRDGARYLGCQAIFQDSGERRFRGYFPYTAISAEACAGASSNPLFGAHLDASNPLFDSLSESADFAARYVACRMAFVTRDGDRVTGTFGSDQLSEEECR